MCSNRGLWKFKKMSVNVLINTSYLSKNIYTYPCNPSLTHKLGMYYTRISWKQPNLSDNTSWFQVPSRYSIGEYGCESIFLVNRVYNGILMIPCGIFMCKYYMSEYCYRA